MSLTFEAGLTEQTTNMDLSRRALSGCSIGMHGLVRQGADRRPVSES